MKVPVEEYVKKMGRTYQRVLSWLKNAGILYSKIYVTEDYEEAIEEYVAEVFKKEYHEKVAGFCHKGNEYCVIAIDRKKSKYFKDGVFDIFLHELAHATTVDDYLYTMIAKTGERLNEYWAETVRIYMKLILKIEEATGKIRRNPFRILKFPLKKVLERIWKFTRKKIGRNIRKDVEFHIQGELLVAEAEYGYRNEGDIKELLIILNIIVAILDDIIYIKKDIKLARKFLTYLLYMR